MDNLDLIINLVIIALLIPALVYMIRLNRSLTILRQNQSSLGKLVEALNDATFKAENSIPKLKSVTEHSSSDLKEVVENAKELKDDLMFINERADNLADRLEGVIKDGRNIKDGANIKNAAPTACASDQYAEIEDSKSEAEMELLKALRAIK